MLVLVLEGQAMTKEALAIVIGPILCTLSLLKIIGKSIVRPAESAILRDINQGDSHRLKLSLILL